MLHRPNLWRPPVSPELVDTPDEAEPQPGSESYGRRWISLDRLPWLFWPSVCVMWGCASFKELAIAATYAADEDDRRLKEFIAAANPAVVLKLIEVVEAADELTVALEEYRSSMALPNTDWPRFARLQLAVKSYGNARDALRDALIEEPK
jgi:hypothetical protein